MKLCHCPPERIPAKRAAPPAIAAASGLADVTFMADVTVLAGRATRAESLLAPRPASGKYPLPSRYTCRPDRSRCARRRYRSATPRDPTAGPHILSRRIRRCRIVDRAHHQDRRRSRVMDPVRLTLRRDRPVRAHQISPREGGTDERGSVFVGRQLGLDITQSSSVRLVPVGSGSGLRQSLVIMAGCCGDTP
jgi:hypothetical protein